MGNILTASIKIVGVKPLFFNAFGPESIPLEKQERSGVAGNDPTEWRKGTPVTNDGQLFMDASYAFATIREGARNVKKGRGSIQPAVVATLQIVEDRLLVDRFMPGFPNGHNCDIMKIDAPPTDPEAVVYLDVRGAVNPNTKSRCVRYRIACARGWSCEFGIQWDKTVVSRGEMESAVIDAGRLSGIGNGRKIGMGRFTVEKFEVSE